MGIEFLVAADEGVLVDFPDLPVVVPGAQVALQVGGVRLHPCTDLVLDLLDVLIIHDHLVDHLTQ